MLVKKLQTEQIKALKSGDKSRLGVLRYILAQIHNKEIDKKAALSDQEAVSVLKKIARELNESIESSEKGQRSDLVSDYHEQLKIVEEFLPAEISDEELEKKITELIKKNQELYDKNPKALIGICVKELRAQADPARIMKILESYEAA